MDDALKHLAVNMIRTERTRRTSPAAKALVAIRDQFTKAGALGHGRYPVALDEASAKEYEDRAHRWFDVVVRLHEETTTPWANASTQVAQHLIQTELAADWEEIFGRMRQMVGQSGKVHMDVLDAARDRARAYLEQEFALLVLKQDRTKLQLSNRPADEEGSQTVAMFEHILLEADQEDLLITLVEATRAIDRGARRPFYSVATMGSPLVAVIHPGLSQGTDFRTYEGDIEELGRQGLVNITHQERSLKFDVSPLGFRYYEELRHRAGEPTQRIVTELRHHIDSQSFRSRCPSAYDAWHRAEALLWQADSKEQSTAIGHHCREALQECMHALTLERNASSPAEDKAKTVARAKALVASERGRLGDTVAQYLDALVAYWGTMNDLIQRQEHGATKEGNPLVWEDARRVVVGTLLVMTEFEASIRPGAPARAT